MMVAKSPFCGAGRRCRGRLCFGWKRLRQLGARRALACTSFRFMRARTYAWNDAPL